CPRSVRAALPIGTRRTGGERACGRARTAGDGGPARCAPQPGRAEPVDRGASRPPGGSARDGLGRGARTARKLRDHRACRPRPLPDPRRRGRAPARRLPWRRRVNQPPGPMFDQRQVRRAFSRAAPGYEAAARLQRAVEAQLLDTLEYYALQHQDAAPARVVDLGSGLGGGAAGMRKRWPKAQVIAIDLALPMLRESRRREGWHPLRRGIDRICADACALPLADGSVDVLFSNLCLQWVEDLPAVFAGFRRVLRPGGLLLVSTFGQDTLFELRS